MYGFHISDTSEDIWNADVQEKACKSTGAAKDSDLLPCRGSSLPLETLRALLTSLWSKRSCSEEEAGPRGRSLRAGEGRILRHTSSLRVCTKICARSDRVKVLGQDHRWSLHPCSRPAAPPGWLCCRGWLLVPAEPQLRSRDFSSSDPAVDNAKAQLAEPVTCAFKLNNWFYFHANWAVLFGGESCGFLCRWR